MGKKGNIVFSEDGTFLRHLNEGDKIVTREERAAKKEYALKMAEKEKKIKRSQQLRGNEFVMQMINEELKGILSGKLSGYALDLGVRISFEIGPRGGYIITKNINGKNAATFGDLCEIFEGTDKTTSGIIKKLEAKDFLWVTRKESKREKGKRYDSAIEENTYEINPKFFIRGEIKNVVFAKFYLKNFKELTKDLEPADKGFLLEITPYFHMDQYVLCKNPSEKDIYELELFDRKGIAQELGISYDNVKRKIAKLRSAGIIGEFLSSDETALYLHPDLVFKKDVNYEDFDYTDKIRNQFEVNSPEVKKTKQRIKQQAQLYGFDIKLAELLEQKQ